MKYFHYYPDHQARKVFNDMPGFKSLCDDYKEIFDLKESPMFRIADISKEKAVNDEYREVHVYFQLNNNCYPIEIQYNTYYDRQLNNWLHKYLYKKEYSADIGCTIRKQYECGNIRNENEFKEVLKYVLSNCKGR